MYDKQYFLEWIETHRTERGGYSKALIKSLGINWPLTKGWKERFAERHSKDPYKFVLADLQKQYK